DLDGIHDDSDGDGCADAIEGAVGKRMPGIGTLSRVGTSKPQAQQRREQYNGTNTGNAEYEAGIPWCGGIYGDDYSYGEDEGGEGVDFATKHIGGREGEEHEIRSC